MSLRILLDTGVFISNFGRHGNASRTEKAQKLILHINRIKGEILYSQRTLYELKVKNWEERKNFLDQCIMASYHFGNEKLAQIEGTWENIGSPFNNKARNELQLSEELSRYLSRDREFRDRGILLDAIMNKCDYFIHENPKDFKKIPAEVTNVYGTEVYNLLELDLNEFEIILQRATNCARRF